MAAFQQDLFVFVDLDNAPLPGGKQAYIDFRNQLRTLFPNSRLHIKAVGNRFSATQKGYCCAAGYEYEVIHADDSEGATDRKIVFEVFNSLRGQVNPFFIFLASGDADFTALVSCLQKLKYKVALLYPPDKISKDLLREATCSLSLLKLAPSASNKTSLSDIARRFMSTRTILPAVVQNNSRRFLFVDWDSWSFPKPWFMTLNNSIDSLFRVVRSLNLSPHTVSLSVYGNQKKLSAEGRKSSVWYVETSGRKAWYVQNVLLVNVVSRSNKCPPNTTFVFVAGEKCYKDYSELAEYLVAHGHTVYFLVPPWITASDFSKLKAVAAGVWRWSRRN